MSQRNYALSISDLCLAIGLNERAQLRRLRADRDLRDGLQRVRAPTAGGPQEQEFLILEFVPAWISSVDRARATPIVQERLRYLRLFTIRQVYDAIAVALDLPPASFLIDDAAQSRLITRLLRERELQTQVHFFLSTLESDQTDTSDHA